MKHDIDKRFAPGEEQKGPGAIIGTCHVCGAKGVGRDEECPGNVEAPCEVDGNPCDWTVEDGDVEGAYDLYCSKCLRWRDWTKEERPAEVK